MIRLSPPPGFHSRFEAAGLVLEHDGEILLLLRQPHKPQGNQYGPPGGKLDDGETPVQALQREVREETGLHLTGSDMTFVAKTYIRYPDYDNVFYVFKAVLTGVRPAITLDHAAHKDFLWIAPDRIDALPLMQDFHDCVRLAYGQALAA